MAQFPRHNRRLRRCKALQFLQDDVGRLRVSVKVEFGHASCVADSLHAAAHDVDVLDL